MGAIEESAKNEGTKIRFAAYDEVNKVLRRHDSSIHTWNDEQTSGDRVADLLESVAKRLDPLYEVENICIHAHPICPECQNAVDCNVSDGYGGYMCCKSKPWRYGGHSWDCPIGKKILAENQRIGGW
jgi:hypothetical protein